ncbi:MAG: methyltransferase domain-containing protein, partial [Lachnospiraceae bacterium]|nr:methyltransferase domain-containing protein [Lachnospiraceae bacterium]
LKAKFPCKDITAICGSYFDVPFGKAVFDAAVSVESLHHFTKVEKVPLYSKLRKALKPGGYFILTDYFADSDEQETLLRKELLRIRKEEDLPDEIFYHYDTPLTIEHEKEALLAAGFTQIEALNHWETTHTLKAVR